MILRTPPTSVYIGPSSKPKGSSPIANAAASIATNSDPVKPTGAEPIANNAAATKPPEATAPTSLNTTASGTSSDGSANVAQQLPAIDSNTASYILDQIINQSGTPNVLNSYQNVTYHFRLFAMNDMDLYTAAGGSYASPQDFFNKIIPDPSQPIGTASKSSAGLTAVIIAESGSTIYNISDVEFTALIGPNQDTRNVNMTTITVNITEPMGTSFLSALKASSDACNNFNFKNCFYYLELTFKGYDFAGNIVNDIFTNPPGVNSSVMNLQHGDRWLWQVQIVDIDISLDAGGGSYTLNLIYSEAAALDDEVHAIPDLVVASTAPDNTIGSYFKSLGSALTQTWFDNHGVQTVSYGDANHPAFKFFPLNLKNCVTPFEGISDGADPSKFTFLPPDATAGPQQTKTTDIEDGYFSGVIQPGVTIERLIETALAYTKEGQALGLGGPAGNQQTNTKNPVESIVFRVVPNVIITGYNAYYGKYAMTVTFNIIPFYTQYPINSPSQAFNDSSQVAIQNLVKNGLLQKKYNYIFTGLNSEVINFDISLNAKWNVQLPRFFGNFANASAVAPGATMSPTNPPASAATGAAAQATQLLNLPANANTISALSQQIDQEENLLGALNGLATDTQDPVNAATGSDSISTVMTQAQLQAQQDARQQGLQQAQSDFTNLQQVSGQTLINPNSSLNSPGQVITARDQLTADINSKQNALNALAKSQGQVEYNLKPGTVAYAQNLVVSQSGSAVPIPITFSQGYRDSADQTGTGFVTTSSNNVVMMGAILNQMYDFSGNPLMSIDITVRGDPYWLGETNLAALVYLRTDDVAPPDVFSYQSPRVFGETNMILDFKVPYQESSSFTPTLSMDETYRGVYIVTQVKSSFSAGQFTQVLSGKRQPLISLLNAQGATAAALSDGSGVPVTSTATTDTGADSVPPGALPAIPTSNNPSATIPTE